MNMRNFIKNNKTELTQCIKNVCPNCKITNEEIKNWINNDEGLYNWARSEGVRI